MSLPSDDVAFLDDYAAAHAIPSRSAVLHQAVRALRLDELGAAYREAWADWDATEDAADWEPTTGDGL